MYTNVNLYDPSPNHIITLAQGEVFGFFLLYAHIEAVVALTVANFFVIWS